MAIVSVWVFLPAWWPFICAPNKIFRKQGALETGDASLAPWCVTVVWRKPGCKVTLVAVVPGKSRQGQSHVWLAIADHSVSSFHSRRLFIRVSHCSPWIVSYGLFSKFVDVIATTARCLVWEPFILHLSHHRDQFLNDAGLVTGRRSLTRLLEPRIAFGIQKF